MLIFKPFLRKSLLLISPFFSALMVLGYYVPAAAQTRSSMARDSMEFYKRSGMYLKAIPFAKTWIEEIRKSDGDSSSSYGQEISKMGELHLKAGKMQEAEKMVKRGYEVLKNVYKTEHPELARAAGILGSFYRSKGDYANALHYGKMALEMDLRTLGPVHLDVGLHANNIGACYLAQGRYEEAISYFQKSLAVRKKLLGDQSPEVATTYTNLGSSYLKMGRYAQAEPYLLNGLRIIEATFRKDHPLVGSLCNNLGVLYYNQGKFHKAEPYYLKALEVTRKTVGEYHLNVVTALNNLGGLYSDMGNLPEAMRYKYHALEVGDSALGPDHTELAFVHYNLASAYTNNGRYDLGLNHYKESLRIRLKAFGEENAEVAATYNNIAVLYGDLGAFARAITYFHKALDIRYKTLGPNHPEIANSCNNLAEIYERTGQTAKAREFYEKGLKIRERSVGRKHPDFGYSLSNLAQFHFVQGQYTIAESYYLRCEANLQVQIQEYFPILSDVEKAHFLSTVAQPMEGFQAFCVQRYQARKMLSGALYNNQLASKAILLNSAQKFKTRIREAKDSTLRLRFEEWENLQNQIAKLATSSDSSDLAELQTLSQQAQILEKQLILQSENFATLADKRQYQWQDVRSRLKADEAAIELIRIRRLGIKGVITDTSDPAHPVYKLPGLTDTIQYAALIVKPSSKYPEMVLLPNGNELEQHDILYYKNCIRKILPDNLSYGKFWQRISARLGPTVRKVFISPDGVFHSINFNTLFNPKNGKYLLDEIEIRIVTSTKDLVASTTTAPNPAHACLVGYPDYNLDKENRARIFLRKRTAPEVVYNLKATRSEAFDELPGTKTEVETISGLLVGKGWKVESLLGGEALEEAIKEAQKPRIMHIATHGYFQPDSSSGINPLLNSGLLLSGANKTLAGEKDEKVEDGILTAYEAMNLNLDNTDLVVLSACETGLGEIKNGEGVYGLQRAFKVAGAKSIIMSLWKVDDDATQELMVSFYKNWLQLPASSKLSGSSKRTAFLAAQKELKAKYPHPYYWGAFVMVGE